jgi:hypothetical protein
VFSFLSFSAFATHMRCGEITYKHISGNTYEITLTTYTKGTSTQADRCFEQIIFGDGDSAIICRSNFETGDPAMDLWGANSCTPAANPNCSTHHMGEWTPFNICLNIKRNVYITTHTYAGPGTYAISFWEYNRIGGVININDNTPLFIADTLAITYYYVGNISSPTYINPSIDTAQIGICHTYNPMAVDPDGDSLSYQLIDCMEGPNTPVQGYWLPLGISMDAVTGDLVWCSPPTTPPPYTAPYLWNFAIRIKKWRKVNGNTLMVAAVMRDIQILVNACAGMGVNDVNAELPRISISPNPAADFVHVQAINLKRMSYDLIGYDFTGRIVFRQSGIKEENHVFATSELKTGLYLLQAFSNGENIYSGKLQVAH